MDTKTDRLVRTLRLRHLELLVALAETPTMRGAAARLHLSQPAISKMLGELEGCFGARLFERSHQGIQANALGSSAVVRARAVLHELARATEDVDAMQRGVTAVLRVGAPSVTATVPAAIVRLRERLPGAAVQLREGRVHELIHRLLDGELDCVFGAITPELISSDLIPLLEPVLLLKDELCVLASTANRHIAGRRFKWADLQTAQWVLPPKETLVRQAFITVFLNSGVTPPVPVIEAMSSVTIGTVLRQDPSLLCAVRLEHALDEVARGGVHRLKVGPRVDLPSFGLYFRRDGLERSAILTAFADAIRSVSKANTVRDERRAKH
ncbi:DNA-binding transcriptional LysR family regulator [Variovorax boronicumulans]|uniref:DNA-binding transcriptional LysR family regulator n=1 Tax=Variovorax boronicumulans TaxID=436515 RepID=A0AAW8D882_9BURK|nr:LysR substrate-binding domain-containing protein [Variovorax boronicumulans]MDP9896283.1 DNA-binding transcriptional LysR family regulator [Variovorax boronicumulans]MDQ0056407.1 DNA-binding transcriptional LysR family regulator [Variovorax boronicumulans]